MANSTRFIVQSNINGEGWKIYMNPKARYGGAKYALTSEEAAAYMATLPAERKWRNEEGKWGTGHIVPVAYRVVKSVKVDGVVTQTVV